MASWGLFLTPSPQIFIGFFKSPVLEVSHFSTPFR
uniref:Uncharacterized protein n=1 Tax=Anguilla anguilla TaxID=7936 RepID=A0A0E9RKY1_ANGAN